MPSTRPAGCCRFCALVALSLVFGVLSVIPIGGADMPVVISPAQQLLRPGGLRRRASCIRNNVLIVAGALVGASGIILTKIMCKAMNRSLANVLFSGFGAVTAGGREPVQRRRRGRSAAATPT